MFDSKSGRWTQIDTTAQSCRHSHTASVSTLGKTVWMQWGLTWWGEWQLLVQLSAIISNQFRIHNIWKCWWQIHACMQWCVCVYVCLLEKREGGIYTTYKTRSNKLQVSLESTFQTELLSTKLCQLSKKSETKTTLKCWNPTSVASHPRICQSQHLAGVFICPAWSITWKSETQ